jgi:hypothetical protein
MDLSTEEIGDTSRQFTFPNPPVISDSDGQSEAASVLYGAVSMDFDAYLNSSPDFDNLGFSFGCFDSSNPSEVSCF